MLYVLVAIAASGTPDYVYLYGNKGNRGYNCDSPHLYVENVYPGSMLGMDCELVLSDELYWPTDLDSTPMVMVLDGPSVSVDRDDCRFVAHARGANRNTSTVLDCRNF